MTEPQIVAIGDVRVAIFHAERYLETRFPDGNVMGATRDVHKETLRDAADLGYEASADGVWQSLVEHEIAHSVIAPHIYSGGFSRVLRHHAAAEYVPHYARIYEEAIVLGLQRFMRSRACEVPSALVLTPYMQMAIELQRIVDVVMPMELAA